MKKDMNLKKTIIAITIASNMCANASLEPSYTVKIDLQKENTIEITPPKNINGSMYFDKNVIKRNESANFNWSFDYMNEINIKSDTVNYSSQNKSGSYSLSPLRTTEYLVNVKNGNESSNISETHKLQVIQPTPEITFNADKVRITSGEPVNISWDVKDSEQVNITGFGVVNASGNHTLNPSGNTTLSLNATGYYGETSANKNIDIEVIGLPKITNFNVPSSVFVESDYTLSWNGSDISRFVLNGEDLGSSLSKTFKTSRLGSMSYELIGYNELGKYESVNKVVNIENIPTFTGFTVNNSAEISVVPGAALNFEGTGFSSGATLQGRNSTNTANENLPTKANTEIGSTTYYAAANKTLNGVNKNSETRSVKVNVVENPTITSITAPSNVFLNAEFTMSWAGGSNDTYKIKSNNANSGIATSDVSLGNVKTRKITPTAAGTYTYTITATNAAGVSTTSTKSVVVESNPTITTFSASSSSANTNSNITLNWVATNASTLSIDQSVGTVTGSSKSVNVGATAGSKTYTLTASKSLNSVTRTATKSVTVTVNAVVTTPTKPTTAATNCQYVRGQTLYSEQLLSNGRWELAARLNGTLIYNTTMSDADYWNWDTKFLANNNKWYSSNYDGKEYGAAEVHSLCTW